VLFFWHFIHCIALQSGRPADHFAIENGH